MTNSAWMQRLPLSLLAFLLYFNKKLVFPGKAQLYSRVFFEPNCFQRKYFLAVQVIAVYCSIEDRDSMELVNCSGQL